MFWHVLAAWRTCGARGRSGLRFACFNRNLLVERIRETEFERSGNEVRKLAASGLLYSVADE